MVVFTTGSSLACKHRMWADSLQATTPNQATVGWPPVLPAELRTRLQTVQHTAWCLAPEEGSFLVLDNVDSLGTAWQAVLQAGFCSKGCCRQELPSPQLTLGTFLNLTEPQLCLPSRGGNNTSVSVTTSQTIHTEYQVHKCCVGSCCMQEM